MDIRIKEKLKNQQGSSLAFVLIIGMIIMIMVASLLAVANSDFTFTQQTVESRQAYIDAKSVIEYGKIFINNDMSVINTYQLEKIDKQKQFDALEPTTKDNQDKKAALKNRIDQLEVLIDQKEKEYPKRIYGIKNSITENIDIDSLTNKNNGVALTAEEITSGLKLLAECKLIAKGEDAARVYTFNLDVQGLRRELNYKVDIPIQSDSGTGGGSGPPGNYGNDAVGANIHVSANNVKINFPPEGHEKENALGVLKVERYDLSLDIGRDKKNDKFDWLDGKKLYLMAKNIYVTAPMPTTGVYGAIFELGDRTKTETIWFKENYEQNNNRGMTNIFKAKTIIFDGDLTINYMTNLDIECDTLWVKGNILINGPFSSLKINAKNIIIGDYNNSTKGGNVKICDRSIINWTCSDNIWIRGDLELLTNSTDFSNPENRITAKNISIGQATKPSNVTVKNQTHVIWDCENFWLHGNMTTNSEKSYQEFNNIVYFSAGQINLSHMCQISITGKQNSKNQIFVGGIIPLEGIAYNVKIKNFELFQCNGDFGLKNESVLELDAQNVIIKGNMTVNQKGKLNINTQYFDVNGNTYIDDSLMSVNGDGNLKARFNGYEQYKSTVSITGADLGIFGGPVNLTCDNQGSPWVVNANAKRIYFDSDLIKFQEGGKFNYSALSNTKTAVSLKTDIKQWHWEKINNIETIVYNVPLWSAGNYTANVDSGTIPEGLITGGTQPIWVPLTVTLPIPTEPSVSIAWSSVDPVDPVDPLGTNKRGTEKYY